ncbi:hypothetical protein LG299_14110 [Microbacterium lacus]|uniref:hypothetical protein n=1 Tax=Microbacterium lacus TaxID=415217 RepID=UPI00384ADB53
MSADQSADASATPAEQSAANTTAPEPEAPKTLGDPVIAAAATSVSKRVDLLRPRVMWLLFLGTLSVAALIALGEVDRLISAVTGAGRTSFSLSSVGGPLGFTARGAWAEWASSGLNDEVATWVICSIVLDVIFIVCYVVVLLIFIRGWTSANPREFSGSEWILWTLVAVEVVEIVLLLCAQGLVRAGAEASETLLEVASWAVLGVALIKWIVFAVLVAAILRNDGTRHALGRIIARTWHALWLHRLSTVLVVLLFVLACIPQDGVLDQLPDIQRGWIGSPMGVVFFLAAMGAILLAAIAAFALGRARTRRGISRWAGKIPTADEEVRNTLGWWAIAPAAWIGVWLITLAVALLNGRPLFESVAASAAFFWVILAIVVVPSIIFRKREWATKPIKADKPRAVYTWLVGDALAIAVFIVGGLGLVRSMAAPVFLGPDETVGFGLALLLFIIGAVIAITSPFLFWGLSRGTPWRVLKPLVRRNDPTESRAAGTDQFGRHVFWLVIICAAAIVILILTALYPMHIASGIGPVALTVLIITAWTALLGSFTVAIQDYRPLALFRWMRLEATPVLTLAITLPLIYAAVVSSQGWDPTLHAVREIEAVTPSEEEEEEEDDATPEEPTIDTLADRIAQLDCTATIGGKLVQPVVLIAAEGGGIRAAYWTARALDELKEKHPCIAESVLVSSGVSGGSVGLVLTATGAVNGEPALQTTRDGKVREADEAWAGLAGPGVVGSAAAALLSGDVIASALGIHVPSFDETDGFEWRDRAALIERGWIAAADELKEPYDASSNERTGFMLLNSTDTNSGCRVLVGSDVFETGSAPPDCESAGDAPATSWWLGDECQTSLDWASAAMLSGRFPIVTPAGQMPTASGCPRDAQLIDGGYSEGSALGTIADLGPAIMRSIQSANAEPGRENYLFPIVVYLRNSSGFDIVKPLGELTAEPLVPLVGFAAAAQQVTDVTWLQRISASLANACPALPMVDGKYPAKPSDCEETNSAARKDIRNGVVVVAPGTTPTVVPPLGWALSNYSIDSLEQALKVESECEKGKSAVAGASRLCELP